jgi:DNA-binding transcriptional LysR family regulator
VHETKYSRYLMVDLVELREIRVFLALADELHFGRTAEQLGLTQSRVSQSLRGLEHKLGVQLFHRTSRRVSLTAAGERFREDIGAAYGELTDALRRAHSTSHDVSGTVRLGAHNAATIEARLLAVIDSFEAANPACTVKVVELSFGDRVDPLKHGEIDLLVTHLPVDDAELVVGPIVDREERLLALAHDHPLADRAAVSLEDIADYDVGWPDLLLPQISDAFVPSHAPSGRPIRRVRLGIRDIGELVVTIARGKVVHPTVTSFASHYAHPRVRYIPIADLPPSETALVWRRRADSAALRELIRVARAAL